MKNKKKKSNDKRENTNLIMAIRSGNISKVKKILENNEINLNEEMGGNLPIFDAICTLNLDLVKLLVHHGANLEKENKNKLTVLTIAIMSSASSYYESLAKYIIDNTSVEHLDKQVLGITPLIFAVYVKNKMLVEYLIKKGASMTTRDSQNNSPLLRAIAENNEDMIQLLLKKGAFLKEDNQYKVELLAYLIMNSKDGIYDNIVKLLLIDGFNKTQERIECEKKVSSQLIDVQIEKMPKVIKEANVIRNKIWEEEKNLRKNVLNKRSSKGNILLVEAVRNRKNDIAKLLVEYGADVNIHDANGENAIGLVCFNEECKDLELFEYFCKNGANLRGNYKGESIVKLAFISSNEDLIKHMYMSHINIFEELKNSNFVEFPKHIVDLIYKEYRLCEKDLSELWLTALAVKNLKRVEILIKLGRDINGIVEGRTLLWECCFNKKFKNLDMAQFLIKHGANMNANNNKEQKIVVYACQQNCGDVLDMMISNYADLDVVDEYGKTGLMYACENGDINIVKQLFDNNANVNLQDKNGKTALMYASAKGYIDIVKLIIPKSYIFAKDKNGYSAIMCAYKNNRENVLKLFIEKDIGIYEKDGNGRTLLWNICLGKHGFMRDLASTLLPKYMSTEMGKDEVIKIMMESYRKKEYMGLVELLIDYGLEVNTIYDEGKTLFIKACERNNVALVKLLCDRNADAAIKDYNGYSGMEYAYMNKNKEVLEYLVRRGLCNNINIKGGRTLLWSYCMGKKNKRIDLAKILIDGGEDINKKDDEGKTLLWQVCENPSDRDLYVAQFLIKNKADINSKNRDGKTLLTRACEQLDNHLLKFLVDKGANVELEVMVAANTCNKSRIEFLVNNNVGIGIIDDLGRSLLWALCLNYGIQDLELAQVVIEKNKDYINLEDIYGKTILAEACLGEGYKDINLIEFLMKNGAKIRYNNDKSSVMMDAVKNNYIDVVSVLVEYGADVNEVDVHGNCLLMYACAYGYKDIVKCLVENGAHINKKTREGRTPLMYAASSSQDIEMVKYLIGNGAKLSKKDKYNNTVLMCACTMENARMIECLVSMGAKVDVKNKEGSTPLMYVCNWETENVCIVRYLCEHGANIHAVNNRNNSAIEIARLNGYKNIEYYLNGKLALTRGLSAYKLTNSSVNVPGKYNFVDSDKIKMYNKNTGKTK